MTTLGQHPWILLAMCACGSHIDLGTPGSPDGGGAGNGSAGGSGSAGAGGGSAGAAGSASGTGGTSGGSDAGGGARTCAQIEADYAALAAQDSCNTTSDCQVLGGSCAVGLGGCYEFVNTSVTAAALHALAEEWSLTKCTAWVCRCTPPPSVTCDNGRCVPI